MTVQVTTIHGFTDAVVTRATNFTTSPDGELILQEGNKRIAVYAPGFWLAATKLAEPETTDTQQ